MDASKLIPVTNVYDIDERTQETIHEIINQKRGTPKEWLLSLFDKCNLACGFCLQEHDDVTGMDSIVAKGEYLVANHQKNSFVTINIMGGELFSDDIPDRIFEDYYKLAVTIHEGVKEYQIKFVTNLTYENIDRVIKLFDRLAERNIFPALTTSYDKFGRYNRKSLDLFKRNFELTKHMLGSVNVVLTKQAINAIVNDKDEYFKYLYDNIPICTEVYSPTDAWETYRVSEGELIDFYIFLYDNYPKVEPVIGIMEDTTGTISCKDSTTVLPNWDVGHCKVYNDPNLYNFDPNREDLRDIEAAFVTDRGCISCEFFYRCGLSCFMASSFKHKVIYDECQLKRLHRHIDNNPK